MREKFDDNKSLLHGKVKPADLQNALETKP